jgi:hypothetical protein
VPDNEAAKDYGKAIDYDARSAGAPAQDIAPARNLTVAQEVTTAQEVTVQNAITARNVTTVPGGATAQNAITAQDATAQDVTRVQGVTAAQDAANDLTTAQDAAAAQYAAQDVTTVPEGANAQDAARAPDEPPDGLVAPHAPGGPPARSPSGLAQAAPGLRAVADPAVGSAADPAAGPATDSAADPGVTEPPDAAPWTAGYEVGWVSPATYWRRRVAALAVGIAVLTILAWAVSGVLRGPGAGPAAGHGKPSPAQPGAAHRHGSGNHAGRTRGHAARQSSPQSLPAFRRIVTGPVHAGHQQPGHILANRVRARGARSGHPSPGPLPGVSDVLTAAGSRQQVAAAASRTAPPMSAGRTLHHQARPLPRYPRATAPGIAPCARGDVVLSLLSPRYWYERGRWPLFGVDAVSTGDRPCRFDMGSRTATVVVSAGRNRIWGSADCVEGAGSQTVVLRRGVPAVRWIYWDRATSIPGCRRTGRPVHPGAYTAIAFDGRLSSQVLVFLLGRPGSFLP